MPKLTQDLEEDVADVPKNVLSPDIEERVHHALVAYHAAYQMQQDAKKLADARLAIIADVLEESGEIGCVVDDIPMTWVFPEKSSLDKKKLLAQGVTMAQIEAATVVTPAKHYFRVYLPKEKK